MGMPGVSRLPQDATAVEDNEEDLIIQKAFFATYGLSGSRRLLVSSGKKVSLSGYRGPVIYNQPPQRFAEHDGSGVIKVSWKVDFKTDRWARVEIRDIIAICSGGGEYIYLYKYPYYGWVVVYWENTWIS